MSVPEADICGVPAWVARRLKGNLMQERSTEIIIELKYCERCGGVWCREAGTNANLCGPCMNQEPVLAKRYAEREQQAAAGCKWAGMGSVVVQTLQGVAAE